VRERFRVGLSIWGKLNIPEKVHAKKVQSTERIRMGSLILLARVEGRVIHAGEVVRYLRSCLFVQPALVTRLQCCSVCLSCHQ
jgi:hypothetical protein